MAIESLSTFVLGLPQWTVQSVFWMLGVLAIWWMARSASPVVRHLILVFGVAGALSLPLVSGWVAGPALEVPVPAAPYSEMAEVPMPVSPVPVLTFGDIGLPVPTPSPWWSTLPTSYLVYGGIAGLLLLFFLSGYLRLRMTRFATPPVVHDEVAAHVRDIAWELSISRPISLHWSEKAATPMTWGVRAPVIVLPMEAASWDEDRMRVVLLHEAAHIARFDTLTQSIAHLACVLFWWNPLVWWAASRMKAERERACDDWVLVHGTKPSQYAEHLLQVARSMAGRPAYAWAAVGMARPSELEGRLLSILEAPHSRQTGRATWVGMGALACTMVLLPIASFQLVPKVEAAQGQDEVADAASTSWDAYAAAPEPADPAFEAFADDAIAAEDQQPSRPETCTRSISVNGTLNVHTDVGNVRIETWSRNEAQIEVRHNLGRDLRIACREDVRGVSLRAERASGQTWRPNTEATFLVRIPASVDVQIRTAGGHIEVLHNLSGTVTLNTSGGNITTTHVGRLDALTSGGHITVGGIRQSSTMRTSGGHIRIQNARADVQAHTSGGHISLQFTAQPQGASRLETSGGQIDITLDPSIGVELNAQTSAGRITLPSGTGSVDASGPVQSVRVRIGRGGPALVARTSAGNITVQQMSSPSGRAPAAPRPPVAPSAPIAPTVYPSYPQAYSAVQDSLNILLRNLPGLTAEDRADIRQDIEDALAEVEAELAGIEATAATERAIAEMTLRIVSDALREAGMAIKATEKAIQRRP